MRTSTIRRFLGIFVAIWVVMGASADAQPPCGPAPASPPAEPDFSKVEIKTVKISSNFYTLEGQQGRTGALVGPDGVFLVDSQFAPLTEKIATAIRQISDGRIRFLVNTHVHIDHVNGNENFAKMGAVIMTRDELRTRLAQGNCSAGGLVSVWRPPAPAIALPVVTYRGPVTVHINGEDVQLMPVPVAHTDGDTMVRFPVADVLMTGDFFRSAGYPVIDRRNGGTLKGTLDALDSVTNTIGPNTKVIPGHGAITDKAGVIAHRDMIISVRDRVAQLVRQGKTVEEVIAAKPTSDDDVRVPNATPSSAEQFVRALFAELKGTR